MTDLGVNMRKWFLRLLLVFVLGAVAHSALASSFCPFGKKASSPPRLVPILVQQAPIYVLTPQGVLVPVYPRQARALRGTLPGWQRPPIGQRLGYR